MNIFKFNTIILLITLGLMTGCFRKRNRVVTPTATTTTYSETDVVCPMNTIDSVTTEDIGGFEIQEEANPFENMTTASKNISLTSHDSEEVSSSFKNIYFEYDRYSVKDDQKAVLDYNLDKAKQLVNKGNTLVIEGHACDSAGTAQYNMVLSEDRAKNVAKYFEDHGIDKSNIKVVGFGCQVRVVEEGDKEQQAPNRRVEIKAYPR